MYRLPWSLVAFLGAAFLSMGVYGLKGAGRDEDAEQKGSRFLMGLGDFFLHWFLWALGPAERVLLRAGITPDLLNFAGLVIGLLSGVLVASDHLEAGGWTLVASGVCDILDGRVARATNTGSLYGKFIDSTLDRFAEVFALLGFVFFLRRNPAGAFLAAAAMAGSLLVSYAQARGETVGIKGAGGLMQRAERVVILSLACLIDSAVTAALGWTRGECVVVALGLVAVASLGTAVYRTVWISRRLLGS
jgi:CDP-diacylglycerol--glycerol-3-phosphate 3-phosphatidyltransferase